VKIPYKIYITTPNIQGAGAEGSFYLTLLSETSNTDEVLLTSEGLQKGTTEEINTKLDAIGDITKVILRNSGSDSYQCQKIRIEAGGKTFDFECEEEIACPKRCSELITMQGKLLY